MIGRTSAGSLLILLLGAVGCGNSGSAPRTTTAARPALPPDQRDAELLGHEVLELVDRAVDYRGSHRGRPAGSFRQMGIDSLTPTTVRRLVNVGLEPVVTVVFRKTDDREITSCRGDGQILEEATLNAGRFTVMCTARGGGQRPIQVGRTPSP